jgi:hypothetical protein
VAEKVDDLFSHIRTIHDEGFAGTYEVTVTGAWESVQHTASATLVVE